MENKKPDQHTVKEMKSIKVALFVIAAALIFYLGSVFLKGINVFGKKNYYYAVFENIGALHESTNVTLNGYEIGKVTDIELLSSNPVRICAEILVTEKLDIPEDSQFEVAQKDVLGGMVVNLHLGQSARMAQRGDTLGCYLAGGMLDGVGDLVAQLKSVVASVDTIGQNLKLAFRTEDSLNGGTMIKNTLENLEHTTADLSKLLADNGGRVNSVVSQLDALSKTLGQAAPKIDAIIANVDNITDSLAQANIRTLVNNAQSTVDNVNALIAGVKNGQGTVGQLMQNDSLFKSLNNTIESLDLLVKDIKANPSKYINVTVFGKKEKKDKNNKE
ncbi:MAG: MCE family protein [Bacteroidales bacterium]|nr:MCE family protein [Bacteroidales bacterium]